MFKVAGPRLTPCRGDDCESVRKMEPGKLPYETLVLVCTNKRAPEERVGCASHGRCGAELRDKLKEAVAAKGLKGKVRVSASGCLDLCEEGPNVVVSAPGGKR